MDKKISEKEIRFRNVVAAESEALVHYGLALTKDLQEAEDLAQDAVIKAIAQRGNFDMDGGNVQAWLRTIVKNLFLNRWRRKRNWAVAREEASEEIAYLCIGHGDAPPDRVVEARLDAERALSAVAEPFRAVLQKVDLEGVTYRETAQILQCPLGTVMSRLHRGRRAAAEGLIEPPV